MRAALLPLLLLPLLGCNLQELTSNSEVIRPRVAGVKAEPAEIEPGGSTDLSVLLVHPADVDPLSWGALWFACLEVGGSARGCLGLDFDGFFGGGGGDDDDSAGADFDPRDLQFGVGRSFRYTAHGSIFEEAWADLDPEDRVEGLSVLVSVNLVPRPDAELQADLSALFAAQQAGDQETVERISGGLQALMEDAMPAARRVVISDKSLGTPDPIDCPAEALQPNRNPTIEGLRLHPDPDGRDAGFPLGEVTFVEPEAELVLRPRVADDAAEDYLYITTDDVTECRREAPWFAWFSNAGEFAGDYSYTADPGDLDEVAGLPKVNRLTLPPREEFPAQLKVWVVVRDRRGGLDWTETVFSPTQAP